jgi:hypothetical protein
MQLTLQQSGTEFSPIGDEVVSSAAAMIGPSLNGSPYPASSTASTNRTSNDWAKRSQRRYQHVCNPPRLLPHRPFSVSRSLRHNWRRRSAADSFAATSIWRPFLVTGAEKACIVAPAGAASSGKPA